MVLQPSCSKVFFFCNTMPLLEAETKLIYVIHVVLLKYRYIFVESQAIAHDVKPGFVIFVVYCHFRMVNVYICHYSVFYLRRWMSCSHWCKPQFVCVQAETISSCDVLEARCTRVCVYCVASCDYLHCVYLYYREVCKDGLIVVNLPKHVKIKNEINILLCLTETRNYFVLFYTLISFAVLVIKANEIHHSSTLFYMFRTDLLSIIRSLNTVSTAIGICHASCVDCLLASTSLADSQHNQYDKHLLLWIQY